MRSTALLVCSTKRFLEKACQKPKIECANFLLYKYNGQDTQGRKGNAMDKVRQEDLHGDEEEE